MKSYNKELYPFKSKWIDIDGNAIHYIDEGEGTIILFSHPAIGSSFMYREFIKALRSKYRCIAIDYPGFGLSEKSDRYEVSIENQSQILEKFIKRLNLRDIYGLGHDTGGPSLFGIVTRNNDLFNGLILTDTLIFPISEYPQIDKMLRILGSKFFVWFNASTNFLVNATYRFGVRTRKLTVAERNQYKQMFNTPQKRKYITTMLHNLKASEDYMQNIKKDFELDLRTKPALLIYGDEDPVKKLGIAERIHNLLNDSKLHFIEKEGHFPHEGQSEKMSNIIHNWIVKLTAQETLPELMET